jgi:FlaA1/EpsC-like NDP-sugar epimerase
MHTAKGPTLTATLPGAVTVSSVATLAAVLLAVHAGAYWIRFEGLGHDEVWRLCSRTCLLFLAAKLAVFSAMRMVVAWWRWSTFYDMIALAEATTLAAVAVVVTDYVTLTYVEIPRSILLLDWLGTMVVIAAVRAAVRWVQDQGVWELLRGKELTRALILGEDAASEQLQRAVQRSPRLRYRIVGFVTPRPSGFTRRFGTTPILGTVDHLQQLLARFAIDELLVITDHFSGDVVRKIMTVAEENQVVVRALPSYERLLRESIDIRPQQISIEDLLRREPVVLDNAGLRQWLHGKTVLVTGSAGSIASEICRQLLAFHPARLVALDRAESGQFFLEEELKQLVGHGQDTCYRGTEIDVIVADLNDSLRMQRLFCQYQPDIVFHAAAYKHVPLMERFPGEAVKNIAITTQFLADLSAAHSVGTFVLVSTDKAVRPQCVMGRCKRIAELYVQALSRETSTRFVTVRFGNVLNSAGSVVPLFQRQIERGGPVTVTHPEMTRYFMTIREAAQLVLQAGCIGQSGDTLILDMGEPVRIVDLARDLIRLSGRREGQDIQIEFVGLRPGEKLHEELWWTDEQLETTSHTKILCARSPAMDLELLNRLLNQLRTAADMQPELVRDLLTEVLDQCNRSGGQQPALRRRAA